MQARFFSSKSTKKYSREVDFGSRNGPELTSESPNIRKKAQKSRFWTASFLDYFLAWIRLGFWSPEPDCLYGFTRMPRIPAAQYVYTPKRVS